MLTRPTFLTLYPEFASAPVTLVDAKLAEAAINIDVGVWGNRENEGHGLLTAHYLALSPNGVFARLTSGGDSVYGERYRDALYAVTCALRIF